MTYCNFNKRNIYGKVAEFVSILWSHWDLVAVSMTLQPVMYSTYNYNLTNHFEISTNFFIDVKCFTQFQSKKWSRVNMLSFKNTEAKKQHF